MTDSQEPTPGPGQTARPSRRVIARSLLRAVVSVVVFVAVYYLLPLDTSDRWVAITVLVVGLAVLIFLVVYNIRQILRAAFPVLRAVEALAMTIPLFLVLFAGFYVVMDRIAPTSFTQTLTHTDALYFTVTVFSTVGFGDITAQTEAARVVVTVQMIMDLVIIGLAVQAIVGAARHGRQSRSAKPLSLRSTSSVAPDKTASIA
jgi:voltage-gated potassium channel